MANQYGSRPAKRSGGINATFIGAVFLGICVLIAGINIGSGLRKLNKTLDEKEMSSSNSVNVPSDMSVNQKKYFDEKEAGEYLNISADEVVDLIKKGEITEYIETSKGYSISIQVLDTWFENEAYQMRIRSTATNYDDSSE